MNRFDKFSIVALAVSLGACAGDMARDRIGPTRFTIQVAPLTLSEVGDATWSLAVTNLAGDPVWSRVT